MIPLKWESVSLLFTLVIFLFSEKVPKSLGDEVPEILPNFYDPKYHDDGRDNTKVVEFQPIEAYSENMPTYLEAYQAGHDAAVLDSQGVETKRREPVEGSVPSKSPAYTYYSPNYLYSPESQDVPNPPGPPSLLKGSEAFGKGPQAELIYYPPHPLTSSGSSFNQPVQILREEPEKIPQLVGYNPPGSSYKYVQTVEDVPKRPVHQYFESPSSPEYDNSPVYHADPIEDYFYNSQGGGHHPQFMPNLLIQTSSQGQGIGQGLGQSITSGFSLLKEAISSKIPNVMKAPLQYFSRPSEPQQGFPGLSVPLQEFHTKQPEYSHEVKFPDALQEILDHSTKVVDPGKVSNVRYPPKTNERHNMYSPENVQQVRYPEKVQEIRYPEKGQEVRYPEKVQEVRYPIKSQEVRYPEKGPEVPRHPERFIQAKYPEQVRYPVKFNVIQSKVPIFHHRPEKLPGYFSHTDPNYIEDPGFHPQADTTSGGGGGSLSSYYTDILTNSHPLVKPESEYFSISALPQMTKSSRPLSEFYNNQGPSSIQGLDGYSNGPYKPDPYPTKSPIDDSKGSTFSLSSLASFYGLGGGGGPRLPDFDDGGHYTTSIHSLPLSELDYKPYTEEGYPVQVSSHSGNDYRHQEYGVDPSSFPKYPPYQEFSSKPPKYHVGESDFAGIEDEWADIPSSFYGPDLSEEGYLPGPYPGHSQGQSSNSPYSSGGWSSFGSLKSSYPPSPSYSWKGPKGSGYGTPTDLIKGPNYEAYGYYKTRYGGWAKRPTTPSRPIPGYRYKYSTLYYPGTPNNMNFQFGDLENGPLPYEQDFECENRQGCRDKGLANSVDLTRRPPKRRFRMRNTFFKRLIRNIGGKRRPRRPKRPPPPAYRPCRGRTCS